MLTIAGADAWMATAMTVARMEAEEELEKSGDRDEMGRNPSSPMGAGGAPIWTQSRKAQLDFQWGIYEPIPSRCGSSLAGVTLYSGGMGE